jgi:hypothetical protein
LSSSASTMAEGRRTARLFPHFDTCIGPPRYTLQLYISGCIYATAHRMTCTLRAAPPGPCEVLTTSLSGPSLALPPPLFPAIIFRQGEPPGSPAHLEAPSNTTC